jgi:hypothetical protein
MSATASATRVAAQPQRAEEPAPLGGLGTLVVLISLLPYLCGYLLSPPGKTFLGALNNIGDLTQYLAAIRQGAAGAWRYTNQFTPDHARPLIMYTPYMLAGHFSLGLSPAFTFQALRLVCAGAALAAMAGFCRLFVGPYALRAAWLFVLLAGGLYWLALPLSAFLPGLVNPSALTAPELNPLITLLISPHESLGLAAELAGFVCILRASGAVEPLWSDARPRPSPPPRKAKLVLGAAVSFLVLALSYPFLLPTVGLVLLAYAAAIARGAWNSKLVAATPKRRLRAGGVFAAELRTIILALVPAGLIGLYYLNVFHRDPLWSRSGLTAIGRPDLGVLLFAFGPLAIGAYAGARRLQAVRLTGGDAIPAAWAWFPAIWALVNAATLLLPFWQQGRQALGLTVPLALLSFLALAGPQAVSGRERVSLAPIPASALAFSAPLLLALYTAITAGGINQDYYVQSGVVQAVRWLGDHAGSDDVVLASAGFGNLVPAECACRVVIGQNFQSFDFHARQAEVYAFYAAPNPRAAAHALNRIVRREGVTFVVDSPLERSLGRTALRRPPGFSQVYRMHDVTIFHRVASPTVQRAPAHR